MQKLQIILDIGLLYTAFLIHLSSFVQVLYFSHYQLIAGLLVCLFVYRYIIRYLARI